MSMVTIETFGQSSNTHKYEYAQNILESFKRDAKEALADKFTSDEQRAIAEISLEVCADMMWLYMKRRIDFGGSY